MGRGGVGTFKPAKLVPFYAGADNYEVAVRGILESGKDCQRPRDLHNAVRTGSSPLEGTLNGPGSNISGWYHSWGQVTLDWVGCPPSSHKQVMDSEDLGIMISAVVRLARTSIAL